MLITSESVSKTPALSSGTGENRGETPNFGYAGRIVHWKSRRTRRSRYDMTNPIGGSMPWGIRCQVEIIREEYSVMSPIRTLFATQAATK